MPILNLNNFLAALSNTPDYGRLFARVEHLAQVQKHLLNTIPLPLRSQCTVGKYTTDGLLVIYAGNGTTASRLRHLAPSIQQKMNNAGIKVENIRFSIQPQLYSPKSGNARESTRSLSQTAIKHLDNLSNSLPADSPLHSSLAALLANSRK